MGRGIILTMITDLADLLFRPFAVADVPLLGAWLEDAGLGLPSVLARGDWGNRLISDPRILCRAAVLKDNSVAGFYRLDFAPDRSAEVTLIVSPERRRMGVGRRLLAAALAEARRVGLNRLLAVIHDGNRAAADFFEEAGFEPSGVLMPGFLHLARIVHRSDFQPPLEITP